jgi:tetratricopeptide (TPR) repeat protein
VLASLLAWVAGRERGSRWLASGLSPLLFACALATRETAAVLPLALILWGVTAGRPTSAAPALRATAGHWVVLAAAVAVALALPDYQRFFAASIETRQLYAQLLTQVNAVGYLAGQLVCLDRLNADPMLPVIRSMTAALLFPALALIAALGAGLASLRRHPAVAFGVLWFFLGLAPTNSLLPRFDVANDRQLYLALIGPAWLAGLGIAALARQWRRWTRTIIALAAALMVGLTMATHVRNEVYADEVVFWQDVVGKTLGNSRAFNNLGYALAIAGRSAEAERAFRQALVIDPSNTKAAVNLILLRDGNLVPAAIDQ